VTPFITDWMALSLLMQMEEKLIVYFYSEKATTNNYQRNHKWILVFHLSISLNEQSRADMQ
jgi:hypothetical protein